MKAIFIDRDGTIGGGDDVTFPQNFKLFPFSRYAINSLKNGGYKLFAFTNQPDISDKSASYTLWIGMGIRSKSIIRRLSSYRRAKRFTKSTARIPWRL